MNRTPFVWHPVSIPEIPRLALLVEGIWYAHYTPVVGARQISHMLSSLHAPARMREWVLSPSHELAALVHPERQTWCGYVLMVHGLPEAGNTLLSKFYLVPSARGKGWGKAALALCREHASRAGSSVIWLTANRHNHQANQVYAALGFTRAPDRVQDIGAGYVMDDFVWECQIDKL